MLLIGSSLFLSQFAGISTKNKPIVGWHSIISPSSLSVSGLITTTMSEYAMWSGDTDSQWISDKITSEVPIVGYLQLYSGAAVNPVDYFGMIGDNFSLIGAGYTLQYYDDVTESYIDVETVSDVYPTENKLRFHYFAPIVSTDYRLKIMHSGGTDIEFKISHIKLGTALILQKATYIGISPSLLNRKVKNLVQRGSTGKYLGNTVKSYTYPYQIIQPFNNPLFVRNYVDPFLKHMDGTLINGNAQYGYGPLCTCFYAWRWDEYPDEVLYCGGYESIKYPVNVRSNGLMDWSINGDGEI